MIQKHPDDFKNDLNKTISNNENQFDSLRKLLLEADIIRLINAKTYTIQEVRNNIKDISGTKTI